MILLLLLLLLYYYYYYYYYYYHHYYYYIIFQKQYRGLCAQDLQEAKDLMLVETADMLRV